MFYDNKGVSYLFTIKSMVGNNNNLNAIDSYKCGNKSKFINHQDQNYINTNPIDDFISKNQWKINVIFINCLFLKLI